MQSMKSNSGMKGLMCSANLIYAGRWQAGHGHTEQPVHHGKTALRHFRWFQFVQQRT